MKGVLGNWSMGMEAGGTTWQPARSPHFAKSLGMHGRYDLHIMGLANIAYADAGGERGDEDFFSNSMAMVQARRETGGGLLSLRAMLSLDALMNGKKGVPNLFQTGETADGDPLVDRQHPHEFISELAASYSWAISTDRRAFVYAALAGEPALGNSMFMHRPSGMEIPEAPITHHWFDSTHISFGVLTAGLTFGERWKLDASAFNGREPDEDRYDIESGPLDSSSMRLTHNPTPNWSLTAAYGFLKEPEELEPGEDQHRVTASATHIAELDADRTLAAALMYGRNIKDHSATDAWNLEGTLSTGGDSYFLRYEWVEKDEIFNVPAGSYDIQKLVLGATKHLTNRDGYDWGVGAYVGLYRFPKSLEPSYGKNPITLGLYLRVRPEKVRHGGP